MGAVKDSVKPKSKSGCKDMVVSTAERRGIFGRFTKRKPADSPKTFADMIEMADKALNDLIRTKEIDKEKESGDIEYNMKAVAILQSMQFHLNAIIDLAIVYGELRDEDE